DNGNAEFNAGGFLLTLSTSDVAQGGADIVRTGTGNDVVFGGSARDTVQAGDGTNVVLGDNGLATFDGAGQWLTMETSDPSVGDVDTITTGTGNDAILGGAASDSITADNGNNVVLGDNGRLTSNSAGQVLTVTTNSVANGGVDTINSGTGNDILFGGSFGDTIETTGGNNVIVGDNGAATFNAAGFLTRLESLDTTTGGNDRITSTSGNDIVVGGFGIDTIDAGAGDNTVLGDHGVMTFNSTGGMLTLATMDPTIGAGDFITTTGGRDIVLGGAARDTIAAGNGTNLILGDHGSITLNGLGQWLTVESTNPANGDNDTINTGIDNDVVFGGFGADTINATDGRNVVAGDNARATFNAAGQILTLATTNAANGGIDAITTGSGNDVVLGGTAGDTITVNGGDNFVMGDNGAVTLNAAGAVIRMESTDSAVGGNDTISSLGGNDIVVAGVGNDTVTVSDGRNIVVGDNGVMDFDATGAVLFLATTNVTDGGNDSITSGSGNDAIFAGSGADTVIAGDGRNLVLGDNGQSTFDGQGQWLSVESTATSTGAVDSITTGEGKDTILGGTAGDSIASGIGDDLVLGDSGNITFNSAGQVLTANSTSPDVGGDDVILTDAGDDVVFGGFGNDQIAADLGNNVLLGDNGQATFDASGQLRTIMTTSPSLGGNDTITSGNDHDLVFGGTAADIVTAGDGNNIVLGDNGQASFAADGTLERVEITDPTIGGADIIATGRDNDLIMGGTLSDTINARGGNDLIFGDHGRVTGSIRLTQLPLDSFSPDFTFTSIATQNSDLGGDELILAGAGDDIVIGGQGFDRILGEEGDDDIIGGHSVAEGEDGGDWIDGGTGADVVAGDNAWIHREPRATDTRWRTLSGTQLLEVDGNGSVTSTPQVDPAGTKKRTVTQFDNLASTPATRYGNDAIAGGAENDMIFGQLGNDAIQGDGALLNLSGAMIYDIASTLLSADDYAGSGRDGDDYVEGGGGNDTIFGNRGQDDLIGGSSNLFGATTASLRPDGQDIIYGGSGTRAGRNDLGDESVNGHARDADVILGDNGNIFRIVGVNGIASGDYLQFSWDTYGNQHVVPRTIQYLDYAFGDASNTAFNDQIHGEAGDDIIHGMSGNDVIFGDGQDDDLIGGQGNDRIFGGAGEDGILGDDGRIFTSRNGLTELLHGITTPVAQGEINLPSTLIGAQLNQSGRLKKSVDLATYYVGGHDTIYGGLGDDFIHGGFGDDAISGAEATSLWFITTAIGADSILAYNPTTRMFADYRPGDSLARINNFVLNFDATDANGNKIDDGVDNIFGNEGNDWIVGGTRNDRLFGGMGDDLLNADDNLDTNGGLNNMTDNPLYADADFVYGGAGYDVLIGNTGADRLFDWVKRFNTYVVPIKMSLPAAILAAPTILRDPSAQIIELIRGLALSAGIDGDIDPVSNLLDTELGLFTIEDDTNLYLANVWIGLDRDPLPQNILTGIDTLGGYETLPGKSIVVSNAGPVQVSENGTSQSVRVSLSSPPKSNVVVTVSSANTNEVGVNLSTLTFTPLNWAIPQEIILTGVDDAIADGDKLVNVTLSVSAAKSDATWNTVAARTIAVTNRDNETSTVVVTSPAMRTTALSPTFSWTPVAGATGYEISVTNVSTKQNDYFRMTVNGTSYTPGMSFGIGLYDVWVRAVMPDGKCWAWSMPCRFQIETPVTIQTLDAVQATSRPEVRWASLAGAAKYDVWLANTSTGQTTFLRDMNVTATSWTPGVDLPIGNYRVWVRGIDASGRWGQWSTMATFRVAAAPVVTGPLAPTFDRTPTFEWNAVAGALTYSLTVRNVNTGAVLYNITGLTTTSWTPGSDMADGSYRWQVVAYGIGGLAGNWSAPVEIYVGGRPTFTNTPTGTLPTFSWTNVLGAVRYELQVNRIDVAQANVVRNS
ncbi:MAG: hypothetical protein JNM43_17210, partial [Planctomycetaceae bacterium]|nr:hypothetical protein [Planctomycetaceae bacterium]